MSIDRRELFETLARLQPGAEGTTTGNGAEISVPAPVAAWLARGPAVFAADDRARLDALCRQIDVRKKVSAAYGAEWKRLDPETPAEPAVVSGLVAVLLGNAAQHDGWGLKCTNSALKALELRDNPPRASELRVWAIDVLDDAEHS